MDNLLLITLLLVFLTALITAYVRRRTKERVLKDFDAYHVTVERTDGTLVWGRLRVYSTGLELLFASPHRTGRDGLVFDKTSYLVLQPDLLNVRAIYRYHDELTPANKQRRREDIEHTYNPKFFRRLRRSTRNFLNTFRDAVNESIGLLLTRLKASTPSPVIQSQDQHLRRMSQEALGVANSAYDPILERYIGHRVVVEWQEDAVPEIGGILKEYSPDWLLLLDCRVEQEVGLALDSLDRFRLQRKLDFLIELRDDPAAAGGIELFVKIDNYGSDSVWIDRFEGSEYRCAVDRKLSSGESVEVTVSDLPQVITSRIDRLALPQKWQLVAPERRSNDVSEQVVEDPGIPGLELFIDATREVDLCMPRSRAVVRHGGEQLE